MKKFYETVAVIVTADAFTIALDGRDVKTPEKRLLSLPTEALAQAIASEWEAQVEDILADTMPFLRMSNTALDRVGPRRDTVTSELVNYVHTDLLCYREGEERALMKLQEERWQPVVEWLVDAHDIHLLSTCGILPITQSDKAIDALSTSISRLSDFELTAFHALVTGFGSVSLGLALTNGFRDFGACWNDSILEQRFQEQAWGTDSEVEEARNKLKAEMQTSTAFWQLTQA